LRAADQTTYDTVPAVPADSLALAAVVEFAADNGTDAQSAEAVMAAPNIGDVAPTGGLLNTANPVTITGTGFTGVTGVTFGGIAATNVVEVSDTEITVDTPLVTAPAVADVTVTTPEGSNTMFNGYRFAPAGLFPAFTPIVPPPVIGEGGGPPPTFPPPTPPPIGEVPEGILVGPAIAPAGVPPSLAGFPQPQFESGDAATPPAGGYFPSFTTVFPEPTIVVNGSNFAVAAPGTPPWTAPPPPSTPSTLLIDIDGYAPQEPPWLTPAAMTHEAMSAAAYSDQLSVDEPDEPRPKAKKRRRK
jgi:hypothetical protein